MDAFISKLKDLLTPEFPGAELDLGRPNRRVTGLLVWPGFVGREQIDRQHQLWSFLRSRLTLEEQREIGLILTMTPEEMAAAREA